jgi:hypothetical protein
LVLTHAANQSMPLRSTARASDGIERPHDRFFLTLAAPVRTVRPTLAPARRITLTDAGPRDRDDAVIIGLSAHLFFGSFRQTQPVSHRV